MDPMLYRTPAAAIRSAHEHFFRHLLLSILALLHGIFEVFGIDGVQTVNPSCKWVGSSI
jgi:hypothetical protein